MDIGNRVRELREEQGLSISDLAERSGLTRNGVSRIELGRRKPAADSIEALAKGLNVAPGVLFEDPLVLR
jgi:transcriptional regulator with XRE-family HTH domain